MQFIINGRNILSGEITIGGSKNGAFPLIAASVLTGQHVLLKNIPDITDVHNMLLLIKSLGVDVLFDNNTILFKPSQLSSSELARFTAKRLRASIELTAPLLVRTGKAIFPHPGGCVIGERPIDIFIEGYKKMGAEISSDENGNTITLGKPKAINFVFPTISTTATMCLMMIATVAEGVTVLKNCACEPEISMLADFLNQSGAHISGAGTHTIVIEGIEKFHEKNIEFLNIPDRVETGSLLFMAAAANASLRLKNTDPSHQDAVLDVLERMGFGVKVYKNLIETVPTEKLKAINVKTHEYPGFATDLQSPLIIALTQAEGKSIVHETIFDGRMFWLEDLKRMGARVMILDTHRASIEGPCDLKGKEVRGPDLRAGMAYVIAGLIARGRTIVHNAELIDRGYEKIDERLRSIGADILRAE